MSLRDRLKEIKARKAGQAAIPSTSTPTPPVQPASITFVCGHTKQTEHLSKKPCPACKEKARQEQAKKDREFKSKSLVICTAPPWAERLPDGSEYKTRYITEEQKWAGTLTVKIEGGEIIFVDRRSAVFHLLRELDKQYRKWVKAKLEGLQKKADSVQ